ncbi:MAG: YHS domain-containing protein [Deltaproteobacteria bacterium]|nr:YHS domain-containing protein [Deltaproteobacteria bacterium]
MAKDPVCGMEVTEKDAQRMTHIGHETYYFCSKACQEQFELKEGIRKEEPGKKWWQRILKETKGEPPKCH